MSNEYVFPKCVEVCQACIDGVHVFHILEELADLTVQWEPHPGAGTYVKPGAKILKLTGWASDELFLDMLLKQIAWINRDYVKQNLP